MFRTTCWLMLILAWLTPGAVADQNVVIVFDDSGSMDDVMSSGERRIDAAKAALVSVLERLPPETNVGVLALNSTVAGSSWIIPLGPIASVNWKPNVARLEALGGTPLGEFLKTGADALLDARRKQVYGEFRLLVISDGEANDSRLVDRYLPQILARGLRIEAIGVDMQNDHSLATKVHAYRRADDNTSLERAITEVFAETSVGDQDANEDFEMLEGLPDGFAEQAIAALTDVSNEPLDEFGGSGSRRTISIQNTSTKSWAGVFLGSGCLCFGGFLGLVMLVIIISKAAKKK